MDEKTLDINVERGELIRLYLGMRSVMQNIDDGCVTAQGAREALLRLVGAE